MYLIPPSISGSPSVKKVFLSILVITLNACSSNEAGRSLYEKHIGTQKDYYNGLITDVGAYAEGRSYHRELIDAIHGDIASANRLFHNAYRNDEGEYGETWSSHCFVLLLKIGDARFSSLLNKEDPATQKLVGAAIIGRIELNSADFPQTYLIVRKAVRMGTVRERGR